MQVQYDNQQFAHFRIRGERSFGNDVLPLAEHDDLTVGTDWATEGYCIAPFLDEATYTQFAQGVHRLFRQFFRKAGVNADKNLDPAQYHRYTHHRDDLHLAIVNQAKWLATDQFPIDVSAVEQRVSALCQAPVRAINSHNGERAFHFRIVRPQKHDNNPFHRDVWLEEYHDAINIYVPLAGSDEHSSLPLVPGSHRWSEATVERTLGGAEVDGVQYNVPAVTNTKLPLRPIRPNPKHNEVLIFSPYLLHGGAVNLNEDLTRISLEMRFWKEQG